VPFGGRARRGGGSGYRWGGSDTPNFVTSLSNIQIYQLGHLGKNLSGIKGHRGGVGSVGRNSTAGPRTCAVQFWQEKKKTEGGKREIFKARPREAVTPTRRKRNPPDRARGKGRAGKGWGGQVRERDRGDVQRTEKVNVDSVQRLTEVLGRKEGGTAAEKKKGRGLRNII